jgi:hypothetical protein
MGLPRHRLTELAQTYATIALYCNSVTDNVSRPVSWVLLVVAPLPSICCSKLEYLFIHSLIDLSKPLLCVLPGTDVEFWRRQSMPFKESAPVRLQATTPVDR